MLKVTQIKKITKTTTKLESLIIKLQNRIQELEAENIRLKKQIEDSTMDNDYNSYLERNASEDTLMGW